MRRSQRGQARARFAPIALLLLTLGVTFRSILVAHAAEPIARPYPISPTLPLGVRQYLTLVTSPLMWDVLYRYGEERAAANGAYGPNITAPGSNWYLEYQRAGGTNVIDGVLRGDRELIQSGLRMFHFGLARQARSGAFPGSFQPFHGTALFLAQAAPALMVLANSPVAAQYASEVRWEITRMRRAEDYIVRSVGGPGHIDDHTKDHRWFEEALALRSVGILTHDRTFRRWANRYAERGIRMARPNGVMPEDGGHDSGYQGLGLIFATSYLALLGSGRQFHVLRAVIQRGEAWELSRVRSNGSINQAGDTRTVGCKERDPEGSCKSVLTATIYNALARWAVLSGNQCYERAAHAVWLRR